MKNKYQILKINDEVSYDFPILLEETIDNIGVFTEFDGDIGQINQKCNFTYSGVGFTVTIYNTVNTVTDNKLLDAIFTINWGDGTTSTLPMTQISDVNLPSITHQYDFQDEYSVTITVESPWEVTEATKTIRVPFPTSYTYPTSFGELTFNVPYTESTTHTQQYLQDYTELTGSTQNAEIHFIGIGKSRIQELKKYGSSNEYEGVSPSEGYTGYTIDGLLYMDYPDDVTHIVGTTYGLEDEFFNSEVFNGMITRNENFLGFIDDPTIYSDVFVDRGKISVLENNLRLTEINSIDELILYGNGFFKIVKQ